MCTKIQKGNIFNVFLKGPQRTQNVFKDYLYEWEIFLFYFNNLWIVKFFNNKYIFIDYLCKF